MANDIKISVIIPVYNSEKYLDELIQSLQKQTLNDLEFIFVNDGSTDQSKEVIEKYQKEDCRIILVNQKNAGVSAARNVGVKLAKGNYIAFVDSDDYVKECMFEVLYNKAVETSASIVSCGYILDSNGQKIEYPGQNIVFDRYDAIQDCLKNGFLGMNLWTKLFRKECLQNIAFNEKYRINEDRLYLFDAVCHANKIVIIPDSLYFYRENMKSASHVAFGKKRMDAIWVAKEMDKGIREKYPELLDVSKANIIRSAYAVLLLMYKEHATEKFETEHDQLLNIIKNEKLSKYWRYIGTKRYVQMLMIKYCEKLFMMIKQ